MITQEDILVAKLHLQGVGPWKLSEIAVEEDDALVKTLSAHRIAAEQRGIELGREQAAEILTQKAERLIVLSAYGRRGNAGKTLQAKARLLVEQAQAIRALP